MRETITVEFLSNPSRPAEERVVSRVPVEGEGILLSDLGGDGPDDVVTVRSVVHLADVDPFASNEVVAIVRCVGGLRRRVA